MLQKINTSDMTRMIEAIKEYFRSHQGVITTPLVYIIMKTIIVETYGVYPMYATPDDEMISRMLHLPHNKNKLLSEKDAQSV